MDIKFKATKFHHRQEGMALLDILLAMVIFAVGMLALASLQGNLSRSSADANVRTVGTNVAEEIIEGLRAIQDLETDLACPTDLAAIADDDVYECIVDGAQTTVSRGGTDYGVVASVSDYFLMPDGVTVTSNVDDLPEAWNTDISNFKMVELTVTWADANSVGFQGAPEDDILLGGGSFTVSSIIPSIPNIGSAKIAASENENAGTPPVEYTPGLRPDIIAINVQDGKLKESTTPQPDVVRSDSLSETWFDVITYSQAGDSDAAFLRREEFLVISCECTLMAPDSNNPGLLPTVWNGSEYSDEVWKTKPYGVSANNQQSFYCDTCCRDHHDTSAAISEDEVYDPDRGSAPQWSEPGGGSGGDHQHYSRSGGSLVAASYNETYVEACRMVRKDGFMRVAQDFRQEGFNGFPEGYLDTESGVNEYSGYVVDAVSDMYGNHNAQAINQDMLNAPSTYGIQFPASDTLYATALPYLLGATTQQMRSRGVYVDQLTSDASGLVKCLDTYDDSYDPDAASPNPTPGERCAADGYCDLDSCRYMTHHHQALPFYEVQTTWLNWWNMADAGGPVSVTNEAVADDNAHSRGLAELENAMVDPTQVVVDLEMNRGNTGLTVTDPITIDELNGVGGTDYEIFVDVNGLGGGAVPSGYVWESTTGSSVNKVEFSDVIIETNGNVVCSRTSNSLSCFTPDKEAGSIDLSGYVKNVAKKNDPPEYLNMYICLDDPSDPSAFTVSNTADGLNNSATITWTEMPDVSGISITIEESSCP